MTNDFDSITCIQHNRVAVLTYLPYPTNADKQLEIVPTKPGNYPLVYVGPYTMEPQLYLVHMQLLDKNLVYNPQVFEHSVLICSIATFREGVQVMF